MSTVQKTKPLRVYRYPEMKFRAPPKLSHHTLSKDRRPTRSHSPTTHIHTLLRFSSLHISPAFHKDAETRSKGGRCYGAREPTVTTADTARKEIARDAVEVIEVAKASLDHGEQMLAITRQKAPCLASIEGCKLLHQQPPCLRLVIVRMGDEMDLDAPLVAAHCGTRTRTTTERTIRWACMGTVDQDAYIAVTHSERT